MRSEPLEIGSSSDLITVLAEHGVDTDLWGSGGAKTVGHLLAELRDGDCALEARGDSLVRRVKNVWIDVVATVDGTQRRLVERRQVFTDGRIRERDLPASLGEKCKIDEDPAVAAERGVAEELGIVVRLAVVPATPRVNPQGPPSYPTLTTVYDTSWFSVDLPLEQYVAEGYVERQEDKSTYFEWRDVEPR
jgi:hypothetical protein